MRPIGGNRHRYSTNGAWTLAATRKTVAHLFGLPRLDQRGKLAQALGSGLPYHACHEARPEQRHANADRDLVQANMAAAVGHEAQIATQRQAATAGGACAADGGNRDQRRAVQARQELVGFYPELAVPGGRAICCLQVAQRRLFAFRKPGKYL